MSPKSGCVLRLCSSPVIIPPSAPPRLLQKCGLQTFLLGPSNLPSAGLFLKLYLIVSLPHLNPYELFAS